tara:strand:+ start:845 stop:1711 length:867 start_codon:yes stop_codon:yes gene_type:complete
MAYIGVPQPSRAITSADIAQGAVTLNDISFTDVPANMDISGTIDKHTMRLAEGVTVTGDITISDNLILSKISDDGVGITLTNDSSTRTITGSGSIEASTLAQTPNASLTGMTGTVGSAVTGSPNLNLGNATFPAGHVIQTVQVTTSTMRTTTSGGWVTSPDITLAIAVSGSNKVLVTMSGGFQSLKTGSENAGTRVAGRWGAMRGSTHLFEQDIVYNAGGHGASTATGFKEIQSNAFSIIDTPGAGTHTYAMIYGAMPSGNWTTTQCGRSYASASFPQCSMILQEIKA